MKQLVNFVLLLFWAAAALAAQMPKPGGGSGGGVGGTGLLTLNGLTADPQSFAVGTVCADVTISSTGSTHTFCMPSADLTVRGLVTTASQSFAGAKLFRDPMAIGPSATDAVALSIRRGVTAGTASILAFQDESNGHLSSIRYDGSLLIGPLTGSYEATQIQPAFDESGSIVGMLNHATLVAAFRAINQNNSANNFGVGLSGVAASTHTSGTRTLRNGFEGVCYHIGTGGTLTTCAGGMAWSEVQVGGTIGTAIGFRAMGNLAGAGTITKSVGVRIEAQTAGSTNYGLEQLGATTPNLFEGSAQFLYGLLPVGAAPGTPAAGLLSIYGKTGKVFCFKDDAGVETCPGAGGAPAFSSVTAGTNTAALLMGASGSLRPTSTGIIEANFLDDQASDPGTCTAANIIFNTTGTLPKVCESANVYRALYSVEAGAGISPSTTGMVRTLSVDTGVIPSFLRIWSNDAQFINDSGGDDTYAADPPVGCGNFTGYVDGQVVYLRVATANTTGATLNICGFGAKDIADATGSASLTTGVLTTTGLHMLHYVSASNQFRMPPAGSTSVPGSDTQCIFNDGGAFGADAGCVYNKTTDKLTLAGEAQVGSGKKIFFGGTTSSFVALKPETIDSGPALSVIYADDGAGAAPAPLRTGPIYLGGALGSANVRIGTDTRMELASGWDYCWSSSTPQAAAADLCLTRGAAGAFVELNQGTDGRFADLKLRHIVGGAVATYAPAPTITEDFGTTPSIAGTDTAGRVTVGTGGTDTSGTITFGTAWAVAPACTANDETTTLLVKATATTTTLVLVSATAWTAGDKLTWTCIGY